MSRPVVSVVIPAYNNAAFLGDAIRSVLDQTFTDLELVVVDDASPEDVRVVVDRHRDPRIRYVRHERNRGLSAARNTGIRESSGPIVALLDGDDLFHPEKLEHHVAFLEAHPDVGVTYNARFELHHSSAAVRDLWRPPRTVTLEDLVVGFPFSPSDMVLRRSWAERVGLFDEYYVYVAEDLDLNCRLALAGCRFASVDRALNYRRYHAGRRFGNIPWWMENLQRVLAAVFDHPDCPAPVRATRARAEATHYLLWAAIALAQAADGGTAGDGDLARAYCREAIGRCPDLAAGWPNALSDAMVSHAISDHTVEHEPLLRGMAAQLPPELAWPADRREAAVARGWWLRGVREAIWGREAAAHAAFDRAARLGVRPDEAFLDAASARLLDAAQACGPVAAQAALGRLAGALRSCATRAQVRRLEATYAVNRAFADYHDGRYAAVPGRVLRAVAHHPEYLANRGVLSILWRSLARVPRGAATVGSGT
ncbi:MAG: glycosyltransferase family A protein [Vicinamibacterales bacterium]